MSFAENNEKGDTACNVCYIFSVITGNTIVRNKIVQILCT
jgi:hypothetical protein